MLRLLELREGRGKTAMLFGTSKKEGALRSVLKALEGSRELLDGEQIHLV